MPEVSFDAQHFGKGKMVKDLGAFRSPTLSARFGGVSSSGLRVRAGDPNALNTRGKLCSLLGSDLAGFVGWQSGGVWCFSPDSWKL